MREISAQDAFPHEDKVLKIPKNYIKQGTGNLVCVPIAVLGPEVVIINNEKEEVLIIMKRKTLLTMK